MKRQIKVFVAILLGIFFLTTYVYAEGNTIGLGVFHGNNINVNYPLWSFHEEYEWDSIILHPTYGWVGDEQWEVYFEGDIGLYKFPTGDTYSLGISLMCENNLFDPMYFELGGGFSYWNESPNEAWVRNGVAGLIKYGFGIKWSLNEDYRLKFGYRFTHSSEVTAKDSGMNTHGFMLNVSKSF